MSRIRTIKPEILTDEKAACLSHAAWRLWVSMWPLADDTGRLPAHVNQLAAQVFWGRPETDTQAALAELVEVGLVTTYIVRGQQYALINGFVKHQRINRPSGPKYPAPDDDGSVHALLTDGSVNDSVSDHGVLTRPVPAVVAAPRKAPPPRCAFDFETIYRQYPRKSGKRLGLIKAANRITTEEAYQALRSAVERMADGWRGASREQLKFCPYWSSFITQERWRDDELPMPDGRPTNDGGPTALPAGVQRW